MPAGRPLNPKQLKFAELYLSGLSATEAYVRAGYTARGKSAGNAASALLENHGIQSLIAKATGQAVQTAELTAEYVIAGLKKEAEFYGDGAQHTARIKAYELLGKAVRVWPEDGDKPPNKDDKQVVSVEALTRILAALGARQPQPGGGGPTAGGTDPGDAVGAEPGPAEPGVPE
jgi:phage terminase small subunit